MPSPALQFLTPAWFSVVMGLAGLAFAWLRAEALLGELAFWLSRGLAALAALVFVVLLLASALRWQRHHSAWVEDLRHPVRHAFVATIPVSLLLLTALGQLLLGASAWLGALWWLASLLQLAASLFVLGRWLAPVSGPAAAPGGLWPSVTPLLLIAVVGNVVAPLGGVGLGYADWATVQLGIGIFFWPLLVGLLLVRRFSHGPLADRLLPAWFILLAPPSVVGLALLQLGAPAALVNAVWGVALFTLLWLLPLLRRIAGQPFGMAHWGLSFPLAAFSGLSLALGRSGAVVLLAITSLVIGWLALATWRGLRSGSLLAPEPVAQIQPQAS